MPRRIETGPKVRPKGVEGATAPTTKDDYLARLVKYIPSEIVGLYIAAAGFVPQVDNRPEPAVWWVFAACAVLTPLYLAFVTKDPTQQKGPLWVQVVLGTIAFPVWVFALGGPFVLLGWYKPYIASLVLVFVTFGFGMVEPPPGS
jgi:hypothetical protein